MILFLNVGSHKQVIETVKCTECKTTTKPWLKIQNISSLVLLLSFWTPLCRLFWIPTNSCCLRSLGWRRCLCLLHSLLHPQRQNCSLMLTYKNKNKTSSIFFSFILYLVSELKQELKLQLVICVNLTNIHCTRERFYQLGIA